MKEITVCYFGIYNPGLARSKILISGLKENNINVIECNEQSWGFIKFFKLFFKHWKIRQDYDVMLVAYPGYTIVPLARLITGKPIIFDAFYNQYDSTVLSRHPEWENKLRGRYIRFIDKLSANLAGTVLIESENQKEYYIKEYGVPRVKCQTIYTGAEDAIFYPDEKIAKKTKFTVLFRGRLMPEAGIEYVIKAAEILAKENINFLIIGFGLMEKKTKDLIEKLNLKNVKQISEEMPADRLREEMLTCYVSLGQFADHDRLNRTIPHKAYESLALKIPYITGNTPATREFFKDRENCLMVKLADSHDLADKILELKNNLELGKIISDNGYELYKKEFSPIEIGKHLKELIIHIVSKKNLN